MKGISGSMRHLLLVLLFVCLLLLGPLGIAASAIVIALVLISNLRKKHSLGESTRVDPPEPNESEGNERRETVIIVHGTWAAPRPGNTAWYQARASNSSSLGFVEKLNQALKKRGAFARCWAHCKSIDDIYFWTGENRWVSRTIAAFSLAEYIQRLSDRGWKCHIIAHSHGGNVVSEALTILSNSDKETFIGQIITLGTPYIESLPTIFSNAKLRSKRISRYTGVGAGLFVVWNLILIFAGEPVIPLITLLLTFAGFMAGAWKEERSDAQKRKSRRSSDAPYSILAINSPMDEPWQLLYHLRNSDNFFAHKGNIISYLMLSYRESLLDRIEIDNVHGEKYYADLSKTAQFYMAIIHFGTFTLFFYTILLVAVLLFAVLGGHEVKADAIFNGNSISVVAIIVGAFILNISAFVSMFGADFYSAYFAPFRSLSNRAHATKATFLALGRYFLRKKSWSLLQSIALGMEGYRFGLPSLELTPSSNPKIISSYERLPQKVEAEALEKRASWISKHLGGVSQMFAQLAITHADFNSLLRKIESDQTLVHGAYYTHDDCIERIADWIALHK